MFETLESIEYPAEATQIPAAANNLITHGSDLWDQFLEKGLNRRFPKYVASDPNQVYSALHYVRKSGLTSGDRFLEWGSGFGVATNLAALLGYEATGIELESSLTATARRLADAHATGAEFTERSYIPEGILSYKIQGGTEIEVIDQNRRTYHYEELSYGLDEVDVFFVYPWPGEQEMMLRLFETVAAPDSLLIAYFGDEETQIYRKL